ncbi:MAG: response regulator [Cyclobacteriaceae bacterium]
MKNIILIDDENILRESMADLLEAIGHKVDSYPSIDAAMMNSDLALYDVVICDVGLPGEDAFLFAQTIKESFTQHSFILLSAFSERETIQKGIEAGADHYLVKPPSVEELQSAINNLNPHSYA